MNEVVWAARYNLRSFRLNEHKSRNVCSFYDPPEDPIRVIYDQHSIL